jgi:hypothetical protein
MTPALAFHSSTIRFETVAKPEKTTENAATAEPAKEEEKKKLTLRERFEENKLYIHRIGTMAGIGVGSYTVYAGAVTGLNLLADIGTDNIVLLSYSAGLASALAMNMIFKTGVGLMSLDPRTSYKAILKRVKEDSRVTAQLGGNLKTSGFRAYSHVDGGVRLRGVKGVDYYGWTRFYRPAALQVMFNLSGEKGNAVIGAELESDGRGGFHYNVLALNNLQTNERTVLAGDGKKSIWKGVTKLR